MNIQVMKTMLESLSVGTDDAIDGPSALKLIKKRVKMAQDEDVPMYKIILLDYSMPEMDGPQVAIELRQMLEEARLAIPYICCCTAYGD